MLPRGANVFVVCPGSLSVARSERDKTDKRILRLVADVSFVAPAQAIAPDDQATPRKMERRGGRAVSVLNWYAFTRLNFT